MSYECPHALGKANVSAIEWIKSKESRYPVVHLKLGEASINIAPGDILTFDDDTEVTNLEVKSTTLPIQETSSIQFGRAKFNAIVTWENDAVARVLVFHEPAATLWQFSSQPAYYGGVEYETQVLLRREDVNIDFRIPPDSVSAKHLLDIIHPLRAFAIDAGQDLIYSRSATRKRKHIYECFEPVISVAAGSVRFQLQPGKPKQHPLTVSVGEPLALLAEAIVAGSTGNQSVLLKSLESRVSDSRVLLQRLLAFSKAAMRVGGVEVHTSKSMTNQLIGSKFHQAVENAYYSLHTRRLRETVRLYGVDIAQGWIRVSTIEGQKAGRELWTLRFDDDLRIRIEGKPVPRIVNIVFETSSTPGTARGVGTLIDIKELQNGTVSS